MVYVKYTFCSLSTVNKEYIYWELSHMPRTGVFLPYCMRVYTSSRASTPRSSLKKSTAGRHWTPQYQHSFLIISLTTRRLSPVTASDCGFGWKNLYRAADAASLANVALPVEWLRPSSSPWPRGRL